MFTHLTTQVAYSAYCAAALIALAAGIVGLIIAAYGLVRVWSARGGRSGGEGNLARGSRIVVAAAVGLWSLNFLVAVG